MTPVRLIIDDKKWTSIDDFWKWKAFLNDLLFGVLEKVYCNQHNLSVNLLLTNDKYMKKLNNDFMGKNTATDILSFPQYEKFNIAVNAISENEILLGDIAMSHETVLRRLVNNSFFDRCSHLFVHGLLHLLGMDHDNEENAEKMENFEAAVLGLFSVGKPHAVAVGKDIA
ncbi:MAG: rRNA maturation RNase YbeY [Holosporales bacterium]|nr:rRNA maturation RNase YbeY [Holosporales bacterium]